MAWSAHTDNCLNGYSGNCSIVLSSKIPIMIENKKVITRSLIVLFLSLSIVYALTYQKKESLFKSGIKNWNEITNQTWTQNQWLATQNLKDQQKTTENSQNIKITQSVSLWDMQTSWVDDLSIQDHSNTKDSSTSVSLGSPNIKILPGTTEYFGTLDIVGILWEKPEYTLQDSKWNYFSYYGNHLDFKNTVETLWWNVYEMITESEILQNQLFGDRVSYINLSVFENIRVLMVIEIDGEVWLLQIPADKYHYSKDYLKSLFIH